MIQESAHASTSCSSFTFLSSPFFDQSGFFCKHKEQGNIRGLSDTYMHHSLPRMITFVFRITWPINCQIKWRKIAPRKLFEGHNNDDLQRTGAVYLKSFVSFGQVILATRFERGVYAPNVTSGRDQAVLTPQYEMQLKWYRNDNDLVTTTSIRRHFDIPSALLGYQLRTKSIPIIGNILPHHYQNSYFVSFDCCRR